MQSLIQKAFVQQNIHPTFNTSRITDGNFQLCNEACMSEHQNGGDNNKGTNYLLYPSSLFKYLIFIHCNCLNKVFNTVQEYLKFFEINTKSDMNVLSLHIKKENIMNQALEKLFFQNLHLDICESGTRVQDRLQP